ncbi:MAG: group 1 truncated hemoglobin [Chloroflexi bacterium]|nr:group 1 truncated hemoglobin [Chloroflexota bacterium]
MNSEPTIDRRRTLKGIAAVGASAALAGSGQTTTVAATDDETGDDAAGTPQGTGATEPSLYERLGGIFAIAAVVDRFSDAIITNPKLNANPALQAWNETEAAVRLPGLKFMRTLWIAALAGGPFEYTGVPLDDAHQDFHLTPEEFNEVGAEIVRALEHFEVPARERQELVDAYLQSMPEVVNPAQ